MRNMRFAPPPRPNYFQNQTQSRGYRSHNRSEVHSVMRMAIGQSTTGMRSSLRLRLHYLIYSFLKFRSIPICCGCCRRCQSLHCLMVKFGRTENLLDVLTQYETLEFCRLGLNWKEILPNQNLGHLPENQISAGRRFIENIKEKRKLTIYHEYLKYF